MEATTGRDGDRGTVTGSSSYTVSSSRSSGTIDSTTYTSSSSPHSTISMEAALQLDLELEVSLGTPWIETDTKDAEFAQPIKKPRKEERMKHVKSMVQEFFCKPSANCSIEGGDVNVLGRWFTELGVGWVLHLADDASTWELGHPKRDDMWRWIRALTAIMETIRDTTYFFRYNFVGMPGISEEEDEGLPPESGKQATSLYPLQFTLFIQETMSKMLVFVDAIISKSLCIQGIPYTPPSLHIRLVVHGALSMALSEIRLHFDPPASAEVERIENEMVSLLSTKQGKMFEDIWSTLEKEIRTRILSMEDSSGTQTPQGSSNIHEATYSVMKHINFLLDNHYTVTPLVSQAISLGKYVPQIGEAPPFIGLITEMISCLEEKLITKSQLFLDKGLMFLFLLNNSNFIRQRLKYYSYIKVDVAAINNKVDHYIESYIQVSWASMLACLFSATPLRLVRKYSPLSKFGSKFQKTYSTQKLWKVPDPELRKRLRKAVIEKIIPGYTKYIEDSKVTNPKFAPQELEEMLQEIFEG